MGSSYVRVNKYMYTYRDVAIILILFLFLSWAKNITLNNIFNLNKI